MNRKLVFLNSHPIQYFAPLYQAIAADGSFDLEVWYCSKHGLGAELDRQFGQRVRWDLPVLDGYPFSFLLNWSLRPSIYGFFGLFNPGIITRLWNLPRRSIVAIHGWGYASNWMAFFLAFCSVIRFVCGANLP